jgi:hypothetical protein
MEILKITTRKLSADRIGDGRPTCCIHLLMVKVDYSKWDKLELSDDR